jgi:hypothetical protein
MYSTMHERSEACLWLGIAIIRELSLSVVRGRQRGVAEVFFYDSLTRVAQVPRK